MKNIYFLDTSYILALEIKNEDAHQEVLQNWATLAKSKPFLVTTTYIFDEVVTFLNSRNLHYKGVEVGNRLLESPDIELIEIDRTLFNQGWQFFQIGFAQGKKLSDHRRHRPFLPKARRRSQP